jgi:hypothetical protein
MRAPSRPALALVLAAFVFADLLPIRSVAADPEPAEPARSPASGDAPVTDPLTGHQIYDRVLQNRFQSSRENVRLISGDRSGNAQESRMTVLWKSFRNEQDEPTNGVFSKTVVRYTHPFDLRFSAYLVINNADRADDQFVYLNSRRRIRRINLRGEPVMGSDFGFEDVIPREIEDAEYKRMPDEVYEGRPCYIVEILPTATSNSEYSRLRSTIDKEHPVVLRTEYWNREGVAVKEGYAPWDEVKEVDGIWIPMHAEMKNLVNESWSRLLIENLEPNPVLDPGEFDVRRLESH